MVPEPQGSSPALGASHGEHSLLGRGCHHEGWGPGRQGAGQPRHGKFWTRQQPKPPSWEGGPGTACQDP